MPNIQSKTTKTRLREEFHTGDTHEKICERLTSEGLGYALKNGDPEERIAMSLMLVGD